MKTKSFQNSTLSSVNLVPTLSLKVTKRTQISYPSYCLRLKMENNRRSYGQEGSGRRSYNRKPAVPRDTTWKPTVPAWEKRFCKAVGSLNWESFLDMKKYVYLYDNVLNWNDSAGEEAFCSAKNRFWAEFNGIPCNEAFPDPDLYIDDIDWECQINQELLLDLDCRSVADSDEKRDSVIIFGDSLIPDLPFSGFGWGPGWGDEEDIPKDQGNQRGYTYDTGKENGKGDDNTWHRVKPTGWGDEEDTRKDQGNQQEYTYGKTSGKENGNGAEDYSNDSWHLDKGDGWESDWDKPQNMNREGDFNHLKSRHYGSDEFWRKRDNLEATRKKAGMSRYKVSSAHGEGQNYNSSERNYKGRNQENYALEQNNSGRRQPNGSWNLNACRPNTRQASDNARQTWSWKKQVS